MRYFFRVEYDGSRYCGWQRQPHGTGVQEIVEKTLSVILRVTCTVVGAGRTDKGVHARALGVHFDVGLPIDIRRCQLAMNAVLPDDISIYNLQPVAPDFHARFSAVRRRYCYYMVFRKSPLLYKRAWMLFRSIDWEGVEQNIPALIGTHDFTTFCAAGSCTITNICSVSTAMLERRGECFVFTIEADRFIYKMVRSIVGTLIDIGSGVATGSMQAMLESKNRLLAGTTAPACGLVLDNVFYQGLL